MDVRYKRVEGGCSNCSDCRNPSLIEKEDKWYSPSQFPYCLLIVNDPEHKWNYETAKIRVKHGEYHEKCPLTRLDDLCQCGKGEQHEEVHSSGNGRDADVRNGVQT